MLFVHCVLLAVSASVIIGDNDDNDDDNLVLEVLVSGFL